MSTFTAKDGQVESVASAVSAGDLSNAANEDITLTEGTPTLALEGQVISVASAIDAGALSNLANEPLEEQIIT